MTSTLRQTEMTGVGGVQNIVFPFGEQLSGKKYDDVSVQFKNNYLDEQFDVNIDLTGVGATAGVNDSVAYAETLTTGESATIYSIDSIRYRPGHSGFINLTLGADTTNGGYVHGGGFDHFAQNGFILKISQNNVLEFCFLKNGVQKGSNFANGLDTVVDHGLELSNLNIFLIMYGYLGIADPVLFVKIGGDWKKLHTVSTEGLAPTTHTSTPVFPVIIMSHDGAKAISGSWNGGVIGNGSTVGNRNFHFPTELLTAGTTHQGQMILTGTAVSTVAIFNSKDIYHGKANSTKARLLGYRFEVDIPTGNVIGKVIFQLVASQTLSGTPTYADIDTESSVIQYDYDLANNGGLGGASVAITAGKVVAEEDVEYVGSSKGGATSSALLNAEQIGAYAYAGRTFGVVAKDLGGNAVTVRVKLYWEELS